MGLASLATSCPRQILNSAYTWLLIPGGQGYLSHMLVLPFQPAACLLQDDVQTEKQKLEAEFNQIHEFLEKIEHFLIIMLKKFDKEIVQKRDGVATKLSKEINRLDALITEAEEKCQQPASEFLQVSLP